MRSLTGRNVVAYRSVREAAAGSRTHTAANPVARLICQLLCSEGDSGTVAESLRVLWWNLDWNHVNRNDDQIAAVRALDEAPAVFGLSELSAHRAEKWREVFEPLGYEFIPDPPDLGRRQLRVVLASRVPFKPLAKARFEGLRPQSHSSALIQIGNAEVEVHATHVPNGSANGWVKIEHFHALRAGLAPPHERPQILMGDFNTPQREGDLGLVTFGQNPDGSFQASGKSIKPFTPERPFDAVLWDEGERAVLEGLPNECGMPDAFRVLHPGAADGTWAPRGNDDRTRRFDHIYATEDLKPQAVRHINELRHDDLSDHSAVEATFALTAKGPEAAYA